MNILSKLKPVYGRTSKRLGRGKASGKGGTSSKGHKGQKARSGVKIPRGFEGGQMPLVRRLPKFGFTNKKFKTVYTVINLDRLNEGNEKITLQDMIQKRWVKKNEKVKILGQGELKKTLTVSAHSFSRSAKEAIEKQGGKALLLKKDGSSSEDLKV